jgi:hypothetical protein
MEEIGGRLPPWVAQFGRPIEIASAAKSGMNFFIV